MKRVAKALTSISMLGIAGMFVLNLSSCDALGPEENDDNASVSIKQIENVTFSGGAETATRPLDGEIKGDPQINDVVFSIIYEGEDVTEEGHIIIDQGEFVYENKKKVDLDAISLIINNTACNGTYTLKIDVTAGSAPGGNSTSFTVSGATACGEQPEEQLQEVTVTVGNQDAGPGSALDVDSMKVHQSSDAKNSASIQEAVDVWFGIVESNASMMAPASAPSGFATSSWTVKNATAFQKVTVAFDEITTQSQIDALWSGSGSSLVTIAAGDVFVVQTVEGNNRLLKIVSASDATTGTAEVTGKIK